MIKCYSYNGGSIRFVGIVEDYTSFTFERSYSGIGEWQIVISGYSQNAQYLRIADFIQAGKGVCGLITKRTETRDGDNWELTFKGVELKGLTQKRIVMPPTNAAYLVYKKQTPEYVIANLLSSQLLNAEDKRKIVGSMAAYEAGTEQITYEGRFSSLSEDIIELAETYHIGWYADIEDLTIVWHIYRGFDRRANQSTNNRLIVSYNYDNMNGSTLERNRYITNTALVAGQGEGVERKTEIINDTNEGLNRTEVYIDARDIEDDTLLPQRGAEKLAEYGDADVFEAVPAQGYFTDNYRLTYDLGDIGTLLEENIDFRLTNITEVYENNTFSLNFVFGYDASTLTAALKRLTANATASAAFEVSGTTGAILYGGTWD